jgi:hypothetical protein
MLDEARRGIALRDLSVALAPNLHLVVEQKHGGASGSLIDGED